MVVAADRNRRVAAGAGGLALGAARGGGDRQRWRGFAAPPVAPSSHMGPNAPSRGSPRARDACEAWPMRPTLYEFAGGDDAFLALARAHHARCLADPELNPPFSHPDQHPQHVERLAAYWAEVLGGGPRYSGACAGEHSGVLRMHAHN